MRGETRRFQPPLRHSAGPISAHNQPKSSPRQSLHLTPPSCLLPRSIRPQITFLTDRGPLIRRRSTMAASRGEARREVVRSLMRAHACKHRWERTQFVCVRRARRAIADKGREREQVREKLATFAACSDWLRAIGQPDEWIATALAHAHTNQIIQK